MSETSDTLGAASAIGVRGPRGPALLGLVALANLLLVVGTLALEGSSEEGVRFVVRHTAKGAMLLFVAAFSASSLQALWPSAWSRYALKNRRWLGLSFAFTHLCHLAALVALGALYPDPFVKGLDAATLVGGGLAYVFVVAMAATSWNGAVRRLGASRWRLLHTVGSWYIWLIFFQSYLGRVASGDLFYVPFAGLLVVGAGLRWTRWIHSRRRA
ncbi:MAG: ferric reductase-like transmembrane domain-containing protein [Myxococcota bacterium]